MNRSTECGYRTTLNAYTLDLLDFMDEKITEALTNPASRFAALTEAAGTIPIIKTRLHREEQNVLAQLMLTDFFDVSLETLAVLPDDELAQKTDDFSRTIEMARNLLNARILNN